MDAQTVVPDPVNEKVLGYAPGSAERASLEAKLKELAGDQVELTATIGGEQRMAGGASFEVTMPSDHHHVLGRSAAASTADARAAIEAALAAAPAWAATTFDERAAIFLRAAELLSGPWRDTLNAATMLGQGKTVQQAEIDAACELIDFLRFNVGYASRIRAEQPISPAGVWNRVEYRPLEGFVYAITPFNFTAIAGNLPTAPALMGNVVVWKPSPTQQLAAHFTMRLLEAAGLPAGVINLLPGDGIDLSAVALAHPALAGIHFTGSTRTFQHLWSTVGANIGALRGYPRIVGETGGKDFVVAHPSAEPAPLVTALVRGAFEYCGQKCSAVSRAYLPQSLWDRIKDEFLDTAAALPVGDVRDFGNFTSAVIDRRAFDKHSQLFSRLRDAADVDILVGGGTDDSVGWFVRPTVISSPNPKHEVFSDEYFGPILSVYAYPDDQYEQTLDLVDSSAPYGLTGAVFATDRSAIDLAHRRLRFAAGNFYVNDRPTGSIVGQQPFGGSRASGTNDKAGSIWHLIRWASPRSVKETLVPPTDHRYPHMG
ncbi:L-glutamate gamma-semialdehyde dehydrogenase [Microlunatus elymi]|uniref:L-glutamate gamma-semialdehyde dehydrogenase n=1 Tax=Microlunatus elymi TaxID=2596828 RepID=A0A516PZ39_9ACTN|nr:L-glutamate gamma-semialdehyde dehydrogenase [Microlunatus elymi]QDP96412.1 L-glutamate gamma-semialdehyde dehydrogenase [Microlunatus elymi]